MGLHARGSPSKQQQQHDYTMRIVEERGQSYADQQEGNNCHVRGSGL